MAENGFDLMTVLKEAKACHSEENAILLSQYLAAYSELTRFFDLLGPIFSFVARDLKDKIDTLQQRQRSEYKEHYRTVQSMVQYEVNNNLINRRSPTGLRSGTNMLIRLHRPLQFIIEFMREFRDSDESVRIANLAMKVYNKTLAKYHIWIVRKAARIAVYTLPGRKALMETLCKQEPEKVVELITPVTDTIQIVYDEVQDLYTKYNLLQLP
ncbi:ceramide-1-phosphate transfer protein-like [Glandiceps talaboti]